MFKKLRKHWNKFIDDIYDGMLDGARSPEAMSWALERKRKRQERKEKKCAKKG